MFTDKIKEATLEYHQQTEKILVGKMKSMRSKDDYINLLKIFYSYFGGLEQKTSRYINQENLKDYAQRRKTEAIADDLKMLGSTAPKFAGNGFLPKIDNYLQAFGALYVIEGSTLGGKIISKMIQQHLHIDNGAGLSFFNSYGEHTQQMWDEFKAVLNAAVDTDKAEAIVLNAANQTFACFKRWMEK